MLRIALCQPNVRHYRLPVYDLLAQQEGVDLTVFSGTVAGAEMPPPEQVHFKLVYAEVREWHTGPLHWRWQQAQIDAMDPDRFHVVILSWDLHYRSLRPAMRKARKAGMPVVLHGHGYSKRPGWVRTWLRNRTGRRANAVLLYTRTIADRLINRYGFDPERVFVLNNCLDQRPIQAARRHWLNETDALSRFQREQRIDSTHTIIFVSRLLPANRCDMLIAALRRIRQDRPDAKLILVGDGPDRERLDRMAQQHDQGGHVIFTGAIFDQMELAPWMLSAAVFCYPVNIGLSILNAFGYALPVVTSANIASHNPEIEALEPNLNGLVYRHGDVGDMVVQCLRIMEDAELRKRLSEGALRQVTERYTLRRMVQGYLDAAWAVVGREREVVQPEHAES